MVRQTMPPKRNTRASSIAVSSSQPVSASQPEPQRQTRAAAARKRRHSDGSNAAEEESSQPSKKSSAVVRPATPAKRGRPRKSAPAPGAVIEEDDAEDIADEVVVARATVTPVCSGQAELEDDPQDDFDEEESIELSQSTVTKKVHFGAEDNIINLIEKSTAKFITPHPRTKMSIKRRRTASPSEESSAKRVKHTRTSLPHSLSQEEPTQIIQELRFSPLKTILTERIKRMSLLSKEIDHNDQDGELPSDDMLVLDGTDEFSVDQLPLTPISQSPNNDHMLKGKAIAAVAITPGAHDRAAWNAERKKFQDAIAAFKKDADEARTQLQVLDMELETIGFGEENASALEVLQSIRESFARSREFLETELPGSLPEYASNEDLAEILVANVKEFADRLRTADRELHEKSKLVNDLGGQVNGLIDRLARREIDKAELLEQTTQLSGFNTDKERDIHELEANLRTARREYDELEKALDDEKAHADELGTENSEFEKNVARLSESLQRYQDEEAKLTSKINKMEKEHRATVTAMNKEREETVRDLEDRLDKETVERGEAADLAEKRHSVIEALEARIEEVTNERDDYQEKLEAMTEERNDEQANREDLETSLNEKQEFIEGLEDRINRLEIELADYKKQAESLRKVNQDERTQREAIEKDLDARGTSFKDAEEKLREKGKEANELRQKLFEVQTKNAETIKELQNAASDRDLQYQDDMAAEIGRREKAEDLIQELESARLDLEQQLEQTESDMRDLTVKKDGEIADCKDEVGQKEAEIQNLNEALESSAEAHKTALEQKRRQIEGLEIDVAELQQTIAEHEGTIRDIEQAGIDAADEHGSVIDKRDADIAVLNDQLTELKVQHDNLEKERTRLERKVEHEAENMLDLQNESNAQIESLKRTVHEKQAHIVNIESKARNADKQWEAYLAGRDAQIHSLTSTTERQMETIGDIHSKFTDYIRRSSGFIARLQEQVDATKMHVDEEGSALERDGELLLLELPAPPTTAPGEVVREKVKGKGKKRREQDSGYGLSLGMVNGEGSSSGYDGSY